MKTNSTIAKVKTYLMELTIVAAGVLIALFISNHKEKSQARDYYNASIETVKKEVEVNYAGLKIIIEKQNKLIDTIAKYSVDRITISDLLLEKGGGLQVFPIGNIGLEFYTKNQINSIDFDMMAMLISMNSISEHIEMKLEKFMDFVYPNLFVDSEESKMFVILYLNNVIESEDQLMHICKDFIDEYVEKE
jgi:hypothetical protein